MRLRGITVRFVLPSTSRNSISMKYWSSSISRIVETRRIKSPKSSFECFIVCRFHRFVSTSRQVLTWVPFFPHRDYLHLAPTAVLLNKYVQNHRICILLRVQMVLCP